MTDVGDIVAATKIIFTKNLCENYRILTGMFISCISTAVILVCFPAENSSLLAANETSVESVTNGTGTDTGDVTDISSKISVVFVLLFVVFFQFGAGPIPPFITSEMFQNSIR